MDNPQNFSNQAARVLEHIETLEAQYADVIDASGEDLGPRLRACAVSIDAYLRSNPNRTSPRRTPIAV